MNSVKTLKRSLCRFLYLFFCMVPWYESLQISASSASSILYLSFHPSYLILLIIPYLYCKLEVASIYKTEMITVQFSSVAQLCPTLCDSMGYSTPGLPVHHQLPEFTQTHVYRVGDAIQLSHPLPSPSPPALNLSQHQGLFQ